MNMKTWLVHSTVYWKIKHTGTIHTHHHVSSLKQGYRSQRKHDTLYIIHIVYLQPTYYIPLRNKLLPLCVFTYCNYLSLNRVCVCSIFKIKISFSKWTKLRQLRGLRELREPTWNVIFLSHMKQQNDGEGSFSQWNNPVQQSNISFSKRVKRYIFLQES